MPTCFLMIGEEDVLLFLEVLSRLFVSRAAYIFFRSMQRLGILCTRWFELA